MFLAHIKVYSFHIYILFMNIAFCCFFFVVYLMTPFQCLVFCSVEGKSDKWRMNWSTVFLNWIIVFIRLLSEEHVYLWLCYADTSVLIFLRGRGFIYFSRNLLNRSTERCSRVVNIRASYSGGPGFKSGLETGYPDRIFMVFLSPPSKCWDSTLK
jgi:hypothetical protein